MIAKTLAPSLGFDTSENLTLAQYQFLRSQAQGFVWGCRYVPLAGQGSSSPGVISESELAAALSTGLGLMFVQFSRTSGWSSSAGLADGQAAAAYVLGLGVPATTCLWLDMSPTATVAITTDYANAWYEGAVQAGMEASAPGVYFEPGCPLTAEQRYQMINMQRYWATAANDPNKWVSSRGCSLIQLWNSNKGEYSPELGVEIDADVSQEDYFESAPVAVFGS